MTRGRVATPAVGLAVVVVSACANSEPARSPVLAPTPRIVACSAQKADGALLLDCSGDEWLRVQLAAKAAPTWLSRDFSAGSDIAFEVRDAGTNAVLEPAGCKERRQPSPYEQLQTAELRKMLVCLLPFTRHEQVVISAEYRPGYVPAAPAGVEALPRGARANSVTIRVEYATQ